MFILEHFNCLHLQKLSVSGGLVLLLLLPGLEVQLKAVDLVLQLHDRPLHHGQLPFRLLDAFFQVL